jgi:hypothetical protein
VPTSAVPTSATGKIAACGLEHIVAPHLQRKKHLDYELTTSSREPRSVHREGRERQFEASELADPWLAPRASATNDIALARKIVWGQSRTNSHPRTALPSVCGGLGAGAGGVW